MGNDRTPSDNAEIPANIAQQHDSRGTDNAEDLSEGFSLQKAAELIEDGEYAICLSLLDKQTEPKTDRRQSTLRLICQICLKAHDGQWWQALDLEPGSDAKSIKSAVRKLARKVHPDKCSLPGADEAFKSVLKAAEHVSASDTDAAKFTYDGGNWWEEWDDPERDTRKRKAQEMEEQHGEGHTIWWLQLQDLSVQDLQEEVKGLQKHLFKQQPLPRAERQRRLREARILLNQRIQEAPEADEASPVEIQQGGGFFM